MGSKSPGNGPLLLGPHRISTDNRLRLRTGPAPRWRLGVLSKRVRGDHSQQRHAGVSIGTRMRWWAALTCLDLVAKPSPAREGAGRRVRVFGRVGPPRRRVCHDRGPARPVWPGRDPRRTDERCPAPAAPAPRPRAGPRALTRCRGARGGGPARGAGRRGRSCGAADGLAPPAPAAPDRRRVGPRRRAVPARE